jgi:LmbE family N-acetylglucosaminyl deacetylase
MNEFDPPGTIMVISTHLDDAVLSCAQFLRSRPGTTVVTVFAGAPLSHHAGYNAKTTNETYAPDAMKKRRVEDANALALLAATPVWLELLENDYRPQPRNEDALNEIREGIEVAIREHQPSAVLSPIGLYHPDHLDVSDVCIRIAARATCSWYLYLDLPYGLAIPESVPRRIERLSLVLDMESLAPFTGDQSIKDQAMKMYVSQYDPTKKSHRKGFKATMRGSEYFWNVVGAHRS